MGKDAFDATMQSYFKVWKFKHPYPEDFRAHLVAQNPKTDVSWLVDDLMATDRKPDYGIKSVTKTATGYDVTIVNKGETKLPFPLAASGSNGLGQIQWFAWRQLSLKNYWTI